MKAMILAAGYGTRLRPLTYAVPKPMVPICNRPLLGYAVERFLSIGVKEIVVNLHHLPEVIERYLPAAMSDEELQAIVTEEVAKAASTGADGPRAMGQVIKAVRERAGAAADGSRIAAMVKTSLA